MFTYRGIDSDYVESDQTLSALKQIISFQNHRNFGKNVTVKKPKFLPPWLCYLFIDNFGKVGSITFIESNLREKRDVYVIHFPDNFIQKNFYYSEEELHFL